MTKLDEICSEKLSFSCLPTYLDCMINTFGGCKKSKYPLIGSLKVRFYDGELRVVSGL